AITLLLPRRGDLTVNDPGEYLFNRFGAVELAQLVELLIKPVHDQRQLISGVMRPARLRRRATKIPQARRGDERHPSISVPFPHPQRRGARQLDAAATRAAQS